MHTVLQLLKLVAVLIAAATLGNWFMAEWRTARAAGKPWYAVYLTVPGILILIAIALPVIVWWIR